MSTTDAPSGTRSARARSRAPRAHDLVDALVRPGAISAAAQPIVSLADGSVVGYELLARAGALTELRPDEWLEIANAQGRRVELELACLAAAVRRGVPPNGTRVFVNLSSRTILDPASEPLLAALAPHVIEITEHEPVEDYEVLRERLRRRPSRTTLLAVDDVGAGYSSMSHVLQLRPHFVKIDQSLVRGIHLDASQLAVVKGIVGFVRQCGATSLAEGVEHLDELEALVGIGVDLGQGYLFARPDVGWPSARRVRSGPRPATPVPGGAAFVPLAARVAVVDDALAAADEVTAHLVENEGVLPSVYLERGGVLRFLSGRGQWQVLDGIEPGVGLTGAAFAQRTTIYVADVAGDPRYREAVPGVVAELAEPLSVGGAVVGVLNVDSPAPLARSAIDRILFAARLLEQALERTGITFSSGSPLMRLGRHAPGIASADAPSDLVARTARAALAVAHLDVACVWTTEEGGFTYAGGAGERADLLASLSDLDVHALSGLVADVASSYSTGPIFTRAFGPMGSLRDDGFGTVFVAALRAEGEIAGLLVLAGADCGTVHPEVVEAVELLCVLAGTALARVRHLARLSELAFRDPLTGIANRGSLRHEFERLATAASNGATWLAIADVDGFKKVNDRYGHPMGDDLLVEFARLLGRHIGENEGVFRLGGDEFALILQSGAHDDAHSSVEIRIESIRRAAIRTMNCVGADLSFGATRCRADDRLTDALVRADRALYARKRAGGAGTSFADPR